MSSITIDQLKAALDLLGVDYSGITFQVIGAEPDPVTPTPQPTTNVFPHKITFENSSDQGNGSAAILFRTLKDGDIIAVSANGEQARKGTPYKGCPVFILSKSGNEYSRPLVFVITDKSGIVYTVKSSDSATPSTPSNNEFDHSETYTSYGVRNGGRQAWRISKGGDELGAGPIKFVFASGKSFIVKNPLKNCRDQENCSRNSKADMYGFVYKPGIGPNGEGDDDTGTSHGGIYLHAPYGDSSKEVTMYW